MKAIIDEQLEEVLTKIGVWEDFCNGTVLCSKCRRAIDINNLGLFIPRRGEGGARLFEFYCDDPDCISEFLDSK